MSITQVCVLFRKSASIVTCIANVSFWSAREAHEGMGCEKEKPIKWEEGKGISFPSTPPNS